MGKYHFSNDIRNKNIKLPPPPLPHFPYCIQFLRTSACVCRTSENCKSLVLQGKCKIEIFLSPALDKLLGQLGTKFHFHLSVFPRNTGPGTDIFMKLEYIARSLVKIKSISDWYLFISRMQTKWTKWYAMTSHVIRSLELLFGTHTFHFNCFFDDFNCVFTQIRCLSRVLKHTFKQMDKKIKLLAKNLELIKRLL